MDPVAGVGGVGRQPASGTWIEKEIVTRRVAGQQGTKAGLGVALRKDESEQYFRIAAVHDSSALVGNPDVRVGDILVSVDGIAIKGYNEETTMHLIRGDPDSKIVLVLADDGNRAEAAKGEKHFFLPKFDGGQWSVTVQRAPNGLGLDISKEPDEKYFSVSAVDPQGPAGRSNKVKLGDLLLAIEGRSLSMVDVQQVQRLLQGPVGQRVQLTIGENEKKDLSQKVVGQRIAQASHLRTAMPDRIASSMTIPEDPDRMDETQSSSGSTRDDFLSSSMLPEFNKNSEPDTTATEPQNAVFEPDKKKVYPPGSLGATGLKELEEATRKAREVELAKEAEDKSFFTSLFGPASHSFDKEKYEKEKEWWWFWA